MEYNFKNRKILHMIRLNLKEDQYNLLLLLILLTINMKTKIHIYQ